MDLKIKVKCHVCKCFFEFRPIDVANQEYACPNCRATIDKKIAEHIANGIAELREVPESYPENNQSTPPDTGFSFSIVLPETFGTFL